LGKLLKTDLENLDGRIRQNILEENQMKKPRIMWAMRPTVRCHGTPKGYNRAVQKQKLTQQARNECF